MSNQCDQHMFPIINPMWANIYRIMYVVEWRTVCIYERVTSVFITGVAKQREKRQSNTVMDIRCNPLLFSKGWVSQGVSRAINMHVCTYERAISVFISGDAKCSEQFRDRSRVADSRVHCLNHSALKVSERPSRSRLARSLHNYPLSLNPSALARATFNQLSKPCL